MDPFSKLRSLTIAWIAVLTFGLVFNSGCEPASDGTLELLDTKLSSTKIDDLARTMDFVFSDKRFDQDEFVRIVTLGINRWSVAETELFKNDGWTVDELDKPLTEEYSELPLVQRMGEMSFGNTDPYFFQQSAWLSNIAQRISEETNLNAFELQRLSAGDIDASDESADLLAKIVEKLNDELATEDAVKLAEGLRAFDWVIRNIQLENDPEPSDDELAPGLGYKRYPWQVLIYSRGDYVERAKLFMLLAEQLGIDSVMLSVGEGENARPWCPALLIGGRLYLFDTKLGLPIPSDVPGKIATLSEVKANPELLEQLDLTTEESLADDTDYWVKSDDLKSVQALAYSSPEHCSRRMFQLEKNLMSDYRLSLSSDPSETIAKLPKIEGLSGGVWDIGFKTHLFRKKLRKAIADAAAGSDVIADKIRWHFREEAYIDGFSVYRTGRARYFNGRFVSDGRRRTAIESFYALMYTDKQISDLGTDTLLQRQLGIRNESGNMNAFQRQLRSIQEQMRLVRRDAGFFLAQCHFDNGNIGTAANWLERWLNRPDAERWQPGIEYLLGRSLESRGEYDRAVEYYGRSEDSPQNHGNLIRSRLLKNQIEKL